MNFSDFKAAATINGLDLSDDTIYDGTVAEGTSREDRLKAVPVTCRRAILAHAPHNDDSKSGDADIREDELYQVVVCNPGTLNDHTDIIIVALALKELGVKPGLLRYVTNPPAPFSAINKFDAFYEGGASDGMLAASFVAWNYITDTPMPEGTIELVDVEG